MGRPNVLVILTDRPVERLERKRLGPNAGGAPGYRPPTVRALPHG
jgi:hypothetical protein